MLLALGTTVLLTSSKIVALTFLTTENFNDWFLKSVAEISGVRYVLPSQSILWKAARVSCWFTTLLAGILLVTCGTMILLKGSLGFSYIHVRM